MPGEDAQASLGGVIPEDKTLPAAQLSLWHTEDVREVVLQVAVGDLRGPVSSLRAYAAKPNFSLQFVEQHGEQHGEQPVEQPLEHIVEQHGEQHGEQHAEHSRLYNVEQRRATESNMQHVT